MGKALLVVGCFVLMLIETTAIWPGALLNFTGVVGLVLLARNS